MSAINLFSVDCSALVCPDGALGAMNAQSQNCNSVTQSEVNSIIFWHPTLGQGPRQTGVQAWRYLILTLIIQMQQI